MIRFFKTNATKPVTKRKAKKARKAKADNQQELHSELSDGVQMLVKVIIMEKWAAAEFTKMKIIIGGRADDLPCKHPCIDGVVLIPGVTVAMRVVKDFYDRVQVTLYSCATQPCIQKVETCDDHDLCSSRTCAYAVPRGKHDAHVPSWQDQ